MTFDSPSWTLRVATDAAASSTARHVWIFRKKHLGDFNTRRGVAEAIAGEHYEVFDLPEEELRSPEDVRDYLTKHFKVSRLSAVPWPDVIVSNSKEESKLATRIKKYSGQNIFRHCSIKIVFVATGCTKKRWPCKVILSSVLYAC